MGPPATPARQEGTPSRDDLHVVEGGHPGDDDADRLGALGSFERHPKGLRFATLEPPRGEAVDGDDGIRLPRRVVHHVALLGLHLDGIRLRLAFLEVERHHDGEDGAAQLDVVELHQEVARCSDNGDAF